MYKARRAASPDGAAAVMLAAVAGPRRQAGQGGHALGVPLAQFRQVGQQVAAVSAPTPLTLWYRAASWLNCG